MSDRELLEMAARAAGIEVEEIGRGGELWIPAGHHLQREWNPLEDDGDAFRLAVKLKLDIHFEEQRIMGEFVEVNCLFDEERGSCRCLTEQFQHSETPEAATRLAIVRAAAEIGKAMP